MIKTPEPSLDARPLIVIVGPTASGKTAVAIEIAKKFDGEIICADSRTVYRGLDAGTAKPTTEQQAMVPHHGLDLVDPDESFSAYEFKRFTTTTLRGIQHRCKTPIMVGGTGLYIDSVLFDYEFTVALDTTYRQHLQSKSIQELQSMIKDQHILMPQNEHNKLHLVQALERKGMTAKRQNQPIKNSIVVGIATDREILRKRIFLRARAMFDDPQLYLETQQVSQRYGWEVPGLSGNIYRIVRQLSAQTITKQQAIEQFSALDWQLARRQMTWLRRNPYIKWLPLDEVTEYLTQAIKKTAH